MPRGGQNILPNEVKALKNTLRPDRVDKTAPPPEVKIVRAPRCPGWFNEGQVEAWRLVLKCTKSLGCLGESDVLMLENCAVAFAHFREVYRRDPPAEQKELLAAIKASSDCLTRLGLTSQSRGTLRKVATDKEAVKTIESFLDLN